MLLILILSVLILRAIYQVAQEPTNEKRHVVLLVEAVLWAFLVSSYIDGLDAKAGIYLSSISLAINKRTVWGAIYRLLKRGLRNNDMEIVSEGLLRGKSLRSEWAGPEKRVFEDVYGIFRYCNNINIVRADVEESRPEDAEAILKMLTDCQHLRQEDRLALTTNSDYNMYEIERAADNL